jgi:hypothetical protein
VAIPEPETVTPPGLAITVQLPVEGNPLNPTVPVTEAQLGCTILPVTGARGMVLTVRVKTAVAGGHLLSFGVSVVRVIKT